MHHRSEHSKDKNFIQFLLSLRHEIGKEHVDEV